MVLVGGAHREKKRGPLSFLICIHAIDFVVDDGVVFFFSCERGEEAGEGFLDIAGWGRERGGGNINTTHKKEKKKSASKRRKKKL